MKMREAFEALRGMATGEAFAVTYSLNSYGGYCCQVYLAKDKGIIACANTWEEAINKLKVQTVQPPPDEEGEERGCPANLEARG